jgi:hypothetical protein
VPPDFSQIDGGGLLDGGRVHPHVTAQITAQRGNGSRLDPATEGRMSESLGDSFSDVRVHTDSLAHSLARSVQARAFTTGADIYFASGEYSPGSSAGQQLLAHELTHVVQQRGAPTTGELHVSDPGDALERQAEMVAKSLS